MIDTTDGKKQQSANANANIEFEPDSDIQRKINITDELNKHAVAAFEKEDEVQESMKDSDLEKNFVDATAIPKRQAALH